MLLTFHLPKPDTYLHTANVVVFLGQRPGGKLFAINTKNVKDKECVMDFLLYDA